MHARPFRPTVRTSLTSFARALERISRAAPLALLLGVSACLGSASTDTNTTPVATVVVTPPAVTIIAGATSQLSATLKDASGNALTGRTITWTSSANAVATVSATGNVTGVTLGSATITATAEGKSATAAVSVLRDPCTVRLSIAVGQTLNGTLDSGDCAKLYTNNSLSEAYTLQLGASTTVQIDLTSTALDVRVRIEQAQERTVMGEDDNGGGGTNARFVGALPAGTYIVWASGAQPSATGAYTLSVKTAGALRSR
jgi:hypothetical protein